MAYWNVRSGARPRAAAAAGVLAGALLAAAAAGLTGCGSEVVLMVGPNAKVGADDGPATGGGSAEPGDGGEGGVADGTGGGAKGTGGGAKGTGGAANGTGGAGGGSGEAGGGLECAAPADCGTDTDCLSRACEEGSCVVVLAPPDTACDDGPACSGTSPCS